MLVALIRAASILPAIPPAGLISRSALIVTRLAQTPAHGGIVRVEMKIDEFASAVWVVVGYGTGSEVACDAHRVGTDDCTSECLVSLACVAALCCRTPTPVGLCPVLGTSAAFMPGVYLTASVDAAHSHAVTSR